MTYTIPNIRYNPELRLGANGQYSLDGGINLAYQETALPLNQSPYLLNLIADDRGSLSKRKGQANYTESLGTGSMNGVILYKGKLITVWSTNFYVDGVSVKSDLTDAKAFMWVFNGLLYLVNGTNFIQYDGSTCQNVIAYVPSITQARKPDGTSSVLDEPINLLTGQMIDSFSSDGTTLYQLSFSALASIDEVKVNGSIVTTGFTTNLTLGTVTFTSPIAVSSPNNVKIKFTKTNTDYLLIYGCTIGKEFAGSIFLTGNASYPNRLWKSGLTDEGNCNYFPATGYRSFDNVSGIDQAMINFVQQYDKLIYLKEKSTYITYAQTQNDGSTAFPISYLNSTIGCDMPGSVQVINNNPVWCNTYGGVFMMVSTTVLGEKNIISISPNINGIGSRTGLLNEDINDLKACSSFDDGSKYYLCVGSKCYVWDYSLGYSLSNPLTLKWFIFDNVNAEQFIIIDSSLCYADRLEGKIVKFIDSYNDFGGPINGIWKSKLIDFGYSEMYKNITDLWLTTKADSGSTLNINYYNENQELVNASAISSTDVLAFDWNNVDLDEFIYDGQRFPPTMRFKPGIKNVRYFQIELTNNNADEDLSIITLVIKYILTKKVK